MCMYLQFNLRTPIQVGNDLIIISSTVGMIPEMENVFKENSKPVTRKFGFF